MAAIAIIETFERLNSSSFAIWGVFLEDDVKTPFYFSLSSRNLNELTNRLRSEYELSKEQAAFDLKPGTEIDLTPPVVDPPDPDPETVARQEFLTALDKWRSAIRLIDDNIIESDDVEAMKLMDDVKAKYKPEYITLG